MTRWNERNTGSESPQFEQMIQTGIDTALIHTWCAMPGIVKSFNSTEQRADIECAIKKEVTDETGEVSQVEHPLMINVPVHFTRGGGFCITHSVEPGDSGLIVYASRCIDEWSMTGGIQSQTIKRKHSFSDAIFIPGIASVANAISSFQTDSIEIRSEDRNTRVTIKSGTIEIIAPTALNITSPLSTFTGNVTVTGVLTANTSIASPSIAATGGGGSVTSATIAATGSVSAPSVVVGGVEVAGHNHAQGNDSDGDAQQNTGPMI